MIRKRLTISVVAVMVFSVMAGGAVTTGVLAAEETDDNDSRETATEMAPNSTETGTLEADDTDWYAFDAEAGERIFVYLELGPNDGIIDQNKSARFDIFGPSGEKVNEYPGEALGPDYQPNAGNDVQAMGGTMAEQSGTYYVRVEGTNITDYNLTVETQRLDQHDPNEQPATATPIESNETISGVMSGPDMDTYAIDLEENETINLTTEHSDSVLVNTQLLGPNASDETRYGFLNEDVVAWDYSDSFNYTANESGTYFIWITPHEETIGSYDMEAPYKLSATVSGTDDGDDKLPAEDDSGTDDGATETSDDTESSNKDDSIRDDSTEISDTADTERSDAAETVTDADTDANTRADTNTQADTTEQTSQSGPGFTGGGAVVSLFVTGLFALRRQ